MTIVIFENFEIALVLLGQFQNFQKCTRAIYPNRALIKYMQTRDSNQIVFNLKITLSVTLKTINS